jgi:ribosomal protein S18 acetylase RimI-like enzyme
MDNELNSPSIRLADLAGPDCVTESHLVEAYLIQTEREKTNQFGETFTVPDLPERYTREIEDRATAYANATVHIAKLFDSPVGVVVVQHSAEAHEIKRVWVDPSARGHRVGSALIDAAISEHGLPIRLTVWDWRHAAIRLYGNRGFLHVPSWEDRPRLLCMERPPVVAAVAGREPGPITRTPVSYLEA